MTEPPDAPDPAAPDAPDPAAPDAPDPAAPEDLDQLHGEDRRTLIIGATAMVALVLVGLISAQFFGRSACTRLDTSLLEPRIAGAEVDEVLEVVFGADAAAVIGAALADAEAELGSPVGAADVTGATGLTTARDGVIAIGPITTSLGADLTFVRATADVGNAAVVGSGDPLYLLVLPNQVTGQVDALQPLTTELESLTCVDTSVVGSPLAFLLDAGDGELLLYRADEDGDDPELELRDPVAGRVWRTFISLPTSPPGTVASRLEGALGDDLVVIAYPAVPNAASPSITAVGRSDGDVRWSIAADALFDVVEDAVAAGGAVTSGIQIGSLAPTSVAVGTDLVLVGLRSAVTTAGTDAAGTAAVVAIDAEDGTIRDAWVGADLLPDDTSDVSEVAAMTIAPDGAAAIALRTAGGVRLVAIDDLTATGAGPPIIAGEAGTPGTLRGLDRDERRSVAAIGGDVVVIGSDLEVVVDLGVEVRDVTISPTGSIVLLIGDGDAAVAVEFRS